MKKITELTETRFRTTYNKDKNGNRVKGREEYVAYRKVNLLSGGFRFLHLIVDSTIVGFIYTVIQTLLLHMYASFQSSEIAIYIIGMQFFYFFIPYLLMEHFFQVTVGKLLTQSIVVDEYGNKPNFQTILLRSVIRVIPFDSLTFLGDEARGWHDRLSNTYVISKKELEIIKKLQLEQL
jgi:uncharacterized RDD family membrane protein YckC